jgi:hypothetical protein
MTNGNISSGSINASGNSISGGSFFGTNFGNVSGVVYNLSNVSTYLNTTDLTASLGLINQVNVVNSTNSNYYNILTSGGVASNACLVISGKDSSHNGYSFSQYFYASGISFQGNNSSSWSVTSSSKIKESIVPITNSLSKLIQLEPVTFDYKIPEAHSNRKSHHGFILEDYIKTFPEHCFKTQVHPLEKF